MIKYFTHGISEKLPEIVHLPKKAGILLVKIVRNYYVFVLQI